MTNLQGPIIKRSLDNEVIGNLRLLIDGAEAGYSMSVTKGLLQAKQNGASPHFHTKFSEMLFIISGALQVLAGEQVVTAEAGDLLLIPPQLPHAFGAPGDLSGEYLLVISPGIDRFDYFRSRAKFRGQPLSEEDQHKFDNFVTQSESWDSMRSILQA